MRKNGNGKTDAIIVKKAGKKLLPVKLTPTEKVERGEKVARLALQRDEEEGRAKALALEAKERIGGLTDQIRSLHRTLNRGEEDRDVACEYRYDVRRALRETYRLDTGERVDSQTLSEYELKDLRQVKIPGTEDKEPGTTEAQADPNAPIVKATPEQQAAFDKARKEGKRFEFPPSDDAPPAKKGRKSKEPAAVAEHPPTTDPGQAG